MPPFSDRNSPPDHPGLVEALGPSVVWWNAARQRIASQHEPVEETWAWSGSKAGWTLRLATRRRPIAYLTPLAGECRGSLALSERAAELVRAELDPETVALVEAAPRYPEGRAVRIVLQTAADVERLVSLAAIRMRT